MQMWSRVKKVLLCKMPYSLPQLLVYKFGDLVNEVSGVFLHFNHVKDLVFIFKIHFGGVQSVQQNMDLTVSNFKMYMT